MMARQHRRHSHRYRPGRWLTLALLPLLTSLATAAPQRPNIVLVLVDDAALMDFGIYGGEANTPNIDAIARSGILFTQFRTSPMCAPSRAMLLTGVDSHTAGVSNLPEFLPPSLEGHPSVLGYLAPGVQTLATALKRVGYRTFMTGKWHLGHEPGQLPDSHGFDRSFALDSSGADNWEKKPYLPVYDDAHWFEDGQPTDLPEDFYSSRFLVDRMLDYLRTSHTQGAQAQPAAPFFAYLAFQAIHIPVQVPPEYTCRYDGVYDEGWDALRARRQQRAREIGLIAADAPPSEPPPGLRDWQTLPADEQALWAKSMQVNAGMLEAMDEHFGRLLAHLRQTGQLDNTVFVITSDNGPASSDPVAFASFRYWMRSVGYHRDLETLGERGSFVNIGPEWASAAAGPTAFFKLFAGDGGIRVPLIIGGKPLPRKARGQQSDAFTFITDIAPTLLEMAGAEADADAVAISGQSIMPVLQGDAEQHHSPEEPMAMEAAGQAAVIKGEFKLTRNDLPYGDDLWRLYRIRTDPGETHDLSGEMPGKRAELLADYAEYERRVNVAELPEGYMPFEQMTRNYWRQEMLEFSLRWGWVVIALLGVFVFILRRFFRRKNKAR